MAENFFEDNFEYFRVSTARGDIKKKNCPSSFSNFDLKSCDTGSLKVEQSA